MFNKAPIFVNGFQRGGTNIVMNLIASHPEVSLLGGETHEVFHGKHSEPLKKWLRRGVYFPLLATARQDIFRIHATYERNNLPHICLRYMDLVFYLNKMTAPGNFQQSNGHKIGKTEIARKRLLAKNVNGVVFATPIFARMYPDATFIGLVRNGLALSEGFLRRGWTAEEFGLLYENVCQKMIHDSTVFPNYKIVRFEDLLTDPVKVLKQIYEHSRLDVNQVSKFKLQAKPSMDKDGKRRYTFGGEVNRERHWFPLNEIPSCLRRDVNENQIAQLTDENRRLFLNGARASMEFFGYC